MSLFDHNELFRQSGPQGMLDYLQSKLEAHDLSSEEALALLSALHEELSRAKAADPRVYQAYSRFMDSLQKAMPKVYKQVVSTWDRSRDKSGDERAPEISDEVGEGASTSQKSELEVKEGIKEVAIDGLEQGSKGEEFGEGEASRVEEGDEEIKPEAIRDGLEETKEEDEAEEQEDEEEDIEPEMEQEQKEPEGSAPEEPEQEASREAEGAETRVGESETENEAAAESEAEQEEAKSESVEVESEVESEGRAEMEWPQIEEPEPEEPIEGEESSPTSVD